MEKPDNANSRIVTRSMQENRFVIGRIPFDGMTFGAAVQMAMKMAKRHDKCRQIIFANSYSVVIAHEDADFAEACNTADLVLADGMPIVWISSICGRRIPERIAGPDFMWEILRMCEIEKARVMLIGSEEPHVSRLRMNILRVFPRLDLCEALAAPWGSWSKAENSILVERVNSTQPNVLFLGVSSPKQDLWINQHLPKLNAGIAVGVGAAFDFHSNRIPRAPQWMRSGGLEWLHRLLGNPKRLWKRYCFGNLKFLGICVASHQREIFSFLRR